MIQFTGRPDNGSTSITPYKSGPGADRGSVEQALANPTLANSQISQQSNVTTSLPLLVRPWANKWEQGFTPGSILFAHAGSQTDHRMTTAVDVPVLNFYLESAQRTFGKKQFNIVNVDGSNNDLHPAVKQNGEFITDDHFKWNFYGVVRNDMLADSSLQKLFNCDVFGRSMVGNIFSAKPLSRGDQVSLFIVEMNTHMEYNFFMSPDGVRQPQQATEPVSYQIVGGRNGLICGHSKEPSEQTGFVGVNDVGENSVIKRIHREIPLGVVSHAVSRVPSEGVIRDALRDQSRFTLLPQIEILLL